MRKVLQSFQYFEVFIADFVRQIYFSNTRMLPKKNSLKFSEILESGDYEKVLELMVDKEILALMYKSMEDIVKYFNEKLNIMWEEDDKAAIIQASLVRNCIIHNNSLADNRLSRVSEYRLNDPITLSTSDVHSYGIVVRQIARHIHTQFIEKYTKNNTPH